MTLELRSIGATNINVTALGMGAGPLGAMADRLSEEGAAKIVREALDVGIRYFDTAPMYGYGLSEKRLGSVLAAFGRDSFALSTKAGRLLVPDNDSGDGSLKVRYDYTYAAARASLEASLERLGLDRVDILLCHDIDVYTHGDDQPNIYETAMKGILPALTDLRSEGVIGAFGLGVNEWQVCSQVMDVFNPDCFLLAQRFTLLEQDPLDELLPKCIKNNVSVIIGAPYNSGILASEKREEARYSYRPVDDESWQRVQSMRAICDAHGVDIRAAALQYPLRHAAVASVIPGVRSVEEIKANVEFINTDIPQGLWTDLADAGLSRMIE